MDHQRFEKRKINVIIANHLNKQNVVWVPSGNDFVDLAPRFSHHAFGNHCERKSCREFFSNFNTSKCSCGSLINNEIPSPEGEMLRDCYDHDGVFVFMKIKDLGCVDLFDEVAEGEAEIGFREAVTLLRSLFTSETPLTTSTTFFPFQSSSHPFTIAFKPSISPCDSVLGQVLSLKVYLSKKDRRKVVYAECGEGFMKDQTDTK
ncbi:hypothetical protein F2Q68_00038923, partial [Brassica cretica]